MVTIGSGILAAFFAFCMLFFVEMVEFIVKLVRHYILGYQWERNRRKLAQEMAKRKQKQLDAKDNGAGEDAELDDKQKTE